LLSTAQSSAQMKRTIYEAFEVDSAAAVVLDLVGFTDVEVKAWAGNTVLTEVEIEIWNASPEIVDYFVKEGRYKFAFERKGDDVSIATQVRERKVIKTKLSGPDGCQEQIKVRVFVPDNYYWSNVLEADSDGVVIETTEGLLRWESGNRNSDQVESFDDSKKHKLVKTLLKR
jgi:hypothetical protein